MRTVLIWLASCLALAAQAKPDFIVGFWRWPGERILEMKADQTFQIVVPPDGGKGRWDIDPFTEKGRLYGITWAAGAAEDLRMATTLDLLKGKNQQGEEYAAMKVEAYTVYVKCDDVGNLAVNGKQTLAAPEWGKQFEGKAYLRKGDIVTFTLANYGGPGWLMLELMKGKQQAISGTGFFYTTKPLPDWKTTPDTFGYRSPLRLRIRNTELGPLSEPERALPQKEDETQPKFYFKYVVR